MLDALSWCGYVVQGITASEQSNAVPIPVCTPPPLARCWQAGRTKKLSLYHSDLASAVAEEMVAAGRYASLHSDNINCYHAQAQYGSVIMNGCVNMY